MRAARPGPPAGVPAPETMPGTRILVARRETYPLEEKVPFLDALRNRVLLFDGAMGTEIQKLDPGPDDFPDGRDGFNDGLTITRPEWILGIHRSYLEAGADCIETNTFGSNRIKLDEYGFGGRTVEINREAARLAARAASGVPVQVRYRLDGAYRLPAEHRRSRSRPDAARGDLLRL